MSCEWIGWCALTASEQAAWVQAIGSIAAIMVALWVPTRIAGKERRRLQDDRHYRARALAFILQPLVLSASSSVRTAQSMWANVPSRYDDDDVAERLVVPDGLLDKLPDLHVLGEAGVAIQRAIVAVDQVRIGVRTQYAYWRHAGNYHDPLTGEEFAIPEPDDVDDLFASASAALNLAHTELAVLLA